MSNKRPNAMRVISVRQPRSLADEAEVTLSRAIRDGRFAPGEQLPSEPALARQLGLSRGTLRQAIAVLEKEGLLFRRQGMGTFVLRRSSELRNELNQNYGVTDLIESAGMRAGSRGIGVSVRAADESLARLMTVDEGSPLAVIDRTRTADSRPVARTTDYLPLSDLEARGLSLPGIERWLVERQSLYAFLRDAGVVIQFGLAEVHPVLADETLAHELETAVGAPLLRLSQVDYTPQGHPTIYSDEYLVPSLLTVQVLRKGPG